MTNILLPLLGGMLIGLAASLLLLFNGRVSGVSGITAGLVLDGHPGERSWRAAFVLGLVAGGLLLRAFWPQSFGTQVVTQLGWTIAAGLLVGFGTQLGSGCTSGHGVCGMARGSVRSFAATSTFMLTAMLTLFLVRHVFGVQP